MLKCKPRERRPCGRETISTMGPAPRSCVRPFKKIKTNIKAMPYPDLLNLCILFAEAFDYAFLRYATATPAKTALFPTSPTQRRRHFRTIPSEFSVFSYEAKLTLVPPF